MEDKALNQFKQQGFTVMESVVVIVLLAIIAVIATTLWSGTTLTLTSQAQQLATDIRYTQSLAMTHGQRYRLNLNTASNSYSITDTNGNTVTNPAGGSSVILSSGIIFGAFTNLPNNLVAFDERGIPYTDSAGIATPLTANATIPLTSSGNTSNIQISPETGRVIVQ